MMKIRDTKRFPIVCLLGTAVLAAVPALIYPPPVNGDEPPSAEELTCPIADVDTIDEFIDLADCVLQFVHDNTFAELEPAEQDAVMGYSDLFFEAKTVVTAVMHEWIVPNLSAEDIAGLEFTVQQSRLLEEIEQLQLLHASDAIGGEGKDKAREKAENSVKDLIKRIIDSLPDDEVEILPRIELPFGLGNVPAITIKVKWLKNFVKTLLDVLNEILSVLRGAKPSSGGGGGGTVPTVSEWGLIVMALLLLTAGTIVFARRRRPAVA